VHTNAGTYALPKKFMKELYWQQRVSLRHDIMHKKLCKHITFIKNVKLLK
jgi:hypothetical protein